MKVVRHYDISQQLKTILALVEVDVFQDDVDIFLLLENLNEFIHTCGDVVSVPLIIFPVS
jgi:hypothetical protein